MRNVKSWSSLNETRAIAWYHKGARKTRLSGSGLARNGTIIRITNLDLIERKVWTHSTLFGMWRSTNGFCGIKSFSQLNDNTDIVSDHSAGLFLFGLIACGAIMQTTRYNQNGVNFPDELELVQKFV
jgi:hypothetical protein